MLDAQVNKTRDQVEAPALGAVVAGATGVRALSVAGVRDQGDSEPVTENDPWHLGSNTKAMTAMLVARLAEQGRIDWQDSIPEVLGPAIDDIHPDWDPVTYAELLTHCSGLPANPGRIALLRYRGLDRDARADRLRVAGNLLARSPKASPGSEFEYSNAGYVVAGAMLEKATGKPWEILIKKEIFEPLGLESAGFGAPGSADVIDAPRGHRKTLLGRLAAVEPDAWADNPSFYGPAGTVHMSLRDYGLVLGEFLAGLQGEGRLLTAESAARLVEPGCSDDYASGWGLKSGVLNHAGSNTLWLAQARLWPDSDLAIAVVSNDGRQDTQAEALGALIERLYAEADEIPDREERLDGS